MCQTPCLPSKSLKFIKKDKHDNMSVGLNVVSDVREVFVGHGGAQRREFSILPASSGKVLNKNWYLKGELG